MLAANCRLLFDVRRPPNSTGLAEGTTVTAIDSAAVSCPRGKSRNTPRRQAHHRCPRCALRRFCRRCTMATTLPTRSQRGPNVAPYSTWGHGSQSRAQKTHTWYGLRDAQPTVRLVQSRGRVPDMSMCAGHAHDIRTTVPAGGCLEIIVWFSSRTVFIPLPPMGPMWPL